ncbi:thioredoxin [Volvox carteri f. nagariensis]|uniref:Thioredoxin n=1 Tax=Volvox carteri f. nagariensis TaxID=3068 RepID=D8TVT1_VOLCA|nr:thioredoxin [Volvox carteri f. nagariensis]EFJ48357.1 thioredoxin [Volvox carteri f. nagariensis]|eukprot:XP_002950611.1 thioredoxin [Volvox carteri f. nagariensis]
MAHVVAGVVSRSSLLGTVSRERVAPKCLPRRAGAPCVRMLPTPARIIEHNVAARRSIILRAKVQKISGEELEVAIAGRDTTLIVDFFATWCGPCLLLARELEQVAEQLEGKVKVVKVDVDENPELSNLLKIQGLPTLVIIPKENGKPALRTEGLLPAAQIMEIVAQLESGTLQSQPQPPQEQPL